MYVSHKIGLYLFSYVSFNLTDFKFRPILDPGPNQYSCFFQQRKIQSNTKDMAKIRISEFSANFFFCPYVILRVFKRPFYFPFPFLDSYWPILLILSNFDTLLPIFTHFSLFWLTLSNFEWNKILPILPFLTPFYQFSL